MSGVTLSREGPIQVLCLSAPPVNALSRAVRQGLWDGVDRALADDAVKGILIEGTGRSFSVGANIREEAYPSEPGLTTCWVCGCRRQDVRLMFCHAQPLEIRPPDVPRRLRGALSR